MASIDSSANIPSDLTDHEKEMILQFVTKFQKMEPLQRSNTQTYLSAMVDCSRSAFIDGKQHKKVSVIFSYPPRGHRNDGNPALMSVVELIHAKKLTVKENEYTKQKATWLCEDFNVSWTPKNNHPILANALEQIRKLEF
jgi:hypothetical protein